MNPLRTANISAETNQGEDKIYKEYTAFFDEVYKTMEENYYKPLNRESFKLFLKQFDTKIYSQLKGEQKSEDYIKWRSAALMVENLRDQEDIFSAFYPPEPAKEYQETALDVRVDLGIQGRMQDDGFKISQVEPRSDAYQKGLRIDDVLLAIDGKILKGMTEDEVNNLLNPVIDTKVKLKYLVLAENIEKEIEVISQEYFKQSVFSIPIPVKGIYCLEIQHFNRKTSEDVFRFLEFFRKTSPIKGLIIDLRNNPGGPPLAARELSSFFLPPGDQFAYFQRKDGPTDMLDVPAIPKEYHYDGPLAILINEKSGSASELFSGVLQKKGRAVLLGKNSAGQVMLKSMFHFDDESMLLLVTARGHKPDGSVFSFNGLVPDRYVQDEQADEILKEATLYLVYVNNKQK